MGELDRKDQDMNLYRIGIRSKNGTGPLFNYIFEITMNLVLM